jgi:hypothetical protein
VKRFSVKARLTARGNSRQAADGRIDTGPQAGISAGTSGRGTEVDDLVRLGSNAELQECAAKYRNSDRPYPLASNAGAGVR